PPASTLCPYTTLFRSLPMRLRNFRPDASAQLAALGGPVAWMRRLRAIELAIEQHERELAELWTTLLAEQGGDEERLAREWQRYRSEEHTSELQSRGHL